MSVGDIVAFYLSLIICNCFLSYCILDFSSCFVLRQVCEAIRPVGCCCYIKALHYISICKKVDLDAGWTFAILVIIIIPVLASTDRCRFSIRNNKTTFGISCYSSCIAIYAFSLFNCILDVSFAILFIKLLPSVTPIIVFI